MTLKRPFHFHPGIDYLAFSSPPFPPLLCTFLNTADPLTTRADCNGFCATTVYILFILENSPIIAVVRLPAMEPLPVPNPSLSPKTLAQPIYPTSSVHIPHILILLHHGFSFLLALSPIQPLSVAHYALYVLHGVPLARWARSCCWVLFR